MPLYVCIYENQASFGEQGRGFLTCQAGNPGKAQTTKVLPVNSKADRLAAALGNYASTEVSNFCSLALVANSACC